MKYLKFLLSGIMLGIVSVFLLAVDPTGSASLIAMVCALVVFVIGLLMGKDDEPEKDENLPQRTCPNCHKKHDFDYPKCPFCGHDY